MISLVTFFHAIFEKFFVSLKDCHSIFFKKNIPILLLLSFYFLFLQYMILENIILEQIKNFWFTHFCEVDDTSYIPWVSSFINLSMYVKRKLYFWSLIYHVFSWKMDGWFCSCAGSIAMIWHIFQVAELNGSHCCVL